MSTRHLPAKWIRDLLPKKCVNCGSKKGLVYHHIVPLEMGGVDAPSNIAVLCSVCHGRVHYGKDGVIDHSELIRSGIARAKAEGKHVGRNCANYEGVMKLIAEKSTQFNCADLYEIDSDTMTEDEIMEKAGVKSVCYHRCKRMLLKAMQSETWPYDWPKPVQVRDHPIYPSVIKRYREGQSWI